MIEAKPTTAGDLLTEKDRTLINERLESGDAKGALEQMQYAIKARYALNAASQFDMLKRTSKRRGPVTGTSSLDSVFGGSQNRTAMIGTGRDLETNFSLARGIIQTHINNVVGSGPRIQFKSRDAAWNGRAERFFQRWGKSCDVRGLLNWGRFIRLTERRTIVDGDLGIILTRGLRLQGIEGDRIANPPGIGERDSRWVYGVRVNELMAPLAYGVYRRGPLFFSQQGKPSADDYEREVPANRFVHSFDSERFDQNRGISALVSAVNDLQDSREALEAIKGAIKLENILALVFKLKPLAASSINPFGELTDFGVTTADNTDETRKEFKVAQGVNTIEIENDEEVEALEKKTPNSNFDTWMLFQIRLAAMALDMPLEIAFHYYTRGSFSSLKGAIGQYHTSIHTRRSRLEDQVCTRIANWLISSSIKRWVIEELNGVPRDKRSGLEPPAVGQGINPLDYTWQWDQLPFLEPDEMVKADTDEFALTTATLADINAKRGKDWENQLEQRAREWTRANDLSEATGVPMEVLWPQTKKPGQETAGAPAPTTDDGEE